MTLIYESIDKFAVLFLSSVKIAARTQNYLFLRAEVCSGFYCPKQFDMDIPMARWQCIVFLLRPPQVLVNKMLKFPNVFAVVDKNFAL